MLFRTVILVSALLVFAAASPPYQKRSSVPESLTSIIYLEEPCVRQGGVCLPISQCDPKNLGNLKGKLCPLQRHLDVECCYN